MRAASAKRYKYLHFHFHDPYRPGDSLVHLVDARIKLLLTLAFILTVSLLPSGAWPVYVLLVFLIIGFDMLSELGMGYILKRSLFSLPFILAALPIIFSNNGPTAGVISLGPWDLVITQGGLERFVSIALKSWISIQAAVILASTTPIPDLLGAMRALKVPRLLVQIFGLMWRYLFVMADEAQRMLRARYARSGTTNNPDLKPGGSIRWRAQVAGGMAGSLFVRAIERSDRIYMAMAARGYDGEVRSFNPPKINALSWLILGMFCTFFGILLLLSILFWS